MPELIMHLMYIIRVHLICTTAGHWSPCFRHGQLIRMCTKTEKEKYISIWWLNVVGIYSPDRIYKIYYHKNRDDMRSVGSEGKKRWRRTNKTEIWTRSIHQPTNGLYTPIIKASRPNYLLCHLHFHQTIFIIHSFNFYHQVRILTSYITI